MLPGNSVRNRIVGPEVSPGQHPANDPSPSNSSCHLLALTLVFGKVDGVVEESRFGPVFFVAFLSDN